MDDVSSILSFDEKSDMVDWDEGLCFLLRLLLASKGGPSKESWAFQTHLITCDQMKGSRDPFSAWGLSSKQSFHSCVTLDRSLPFLFPHFPICMRTAWDKMICGLYPSWLYCLKMERSHRTGHVGSWFSGKKKRSIYRAFPMYQARC